MYTTLKPMIPKIIVLILVVLQCDKTPPLAFQAATLVTVRSSMDQERKVPCDKCATIFLLGEKLMRH